MEDPTTVATHLIGFSLAVGAGLTYKIYKRRQQKDTSSVVWIVGASSGIGKGKSE